MVLALLRLVRDQESLAKSLVRKFRKPNCSTALRMRSVTAASSTERLAKLQTSTESSSDRSARGCLACSTSREIS